MLTFYSDHQMNHAPMRELNNGAWMDYAECPERLVSILSAINTVRPPDDHGAAVIEAVHDKAYLTFLRNAYGEWREAGREGDAIGYAFPIRARRKLDHTRIDAKLGAFGFDAASPIAAGTWEAAYWSAQCAISAVEAVHAGDARRAFALCRPPGHHAGADYYGGYCYLNNAAIAARRAHALGLGPVAVLDVDYHHGNGTQDIFYTDPDIIFASIHADPKCDYPYFWGHADECGAHDGLGTTLNLPLARGTQWAQYQPALAKALDTIAHFGAKFLVISYGADTFAQDPISHFALTTDDMQAMGSQIAQAGLPGVIIMEGGYRIDALGNNVAAFLSELG